MTRSNGKLFRLVAGGVLAAGIAAALPAPAGITVGVGDITDRRRNDNVFSGLEVELKLAGESADAKHKEDMRKEAGGDDKTAEALIGLVKAFSGMMNDVGDNDVILQIEDEDGKLQDVEVVGKSGLIDTRGSMSSGGLKILQYSEKLPPEAKLRFLLKTKKSILRTPFSLTNVPLP